MKNVPILLLSILFLFVNTARSAAPGGVTSGLNLWLKADAGITGTTPVTVWVDQSLGGFDASSGIGPGLLTNRRGKGILNDC